MSVDHLLGNEIFLVTWEVVFVLVLDCICLELDLSERNISI